MPEQDLLQKIADSNLEPPLKHALADLVQASPALPMRLAGSLPARTSFILERLVQEALEPPEDNHWWELFLDLTGKAANTAGQAGAPALQSIEILRPLLAARLGPYEEVSLREITSETVRGICLLSDTLSPPKSSMVAPNAYSLSEALFSKVAWYRAIYAGKAAVGFLMIADNPEEHEYFLWRYMIGEPYQGRGYGWQALERLVEYVRTRPGAKELGVSCGQGEGSPLGFYEKFGFRLTGEVVGNEVVLKLPLE